MAFPETDPGEQISHDGEVPYVVGLYHPSAQFLQRFVSSALYVPAAHHVHDDAPALDTLLWVTEPSIAFVEQRSHVSS